MVVAEQCINCAYSGILAIRKVMTPTDILRLNTTHSAHTHIPEMSNYKQERAVSLQNDITEFFVKSGSLFTCNTSLRRLPPPHIPTCLF